MCVTLGNSGAGQAAAVLCLHEPREQVLLFPFRLDQGLIKACLCLETMCRIKEGRAVVFSRVPWPPAAFCQAVSGKAVHHNQDTRLFRYLLRLGRISFFNHHLHQKKLISKHSSLGGKKKCVPLLLNLIPKLKF